MIAQKFGAHVPGSAIASHTTRSASPVTLAGAESPYANTTAAATYARLADPLQFGRPARDLVSLVGLEPGEFALDVGTGTGAVAREAITVLAGNGRVVGVDASVAMLGARRSRAYPVIVGQVPRLPFRENRFDAVLAGFVISHFASYEIGLAELVRVCRPGGRVAISAWGSLGNAAARLWADTAAAFVPRERLDAAFLGDIPWEAHFANRHNLERAFRESGVQRVGIVTREYVIEMTRSDFLSAREGTFQGMLLQRALSAPQWQEFQTLMGEAFQRQFGDRVTYTRDVHLAIGEKPGSGRESLVAFHDAPSPITFWR